MNAESYQFRNYPRRVAERAWQRIAGHRDWISLDRFAALLTNVTHNDQKSRDLVAAAVCGTAFLGRSGRRLVLFLPKPQPYFPRSEAWRLTAGDLVRYFQLELRDWYMESIWVPIPLVKNWCAEKGYLYTPPQKQIADKLPDSPIDPKLNHKKRRATPKELRRKPGPKPKYPWNTKVKAAVFSAMDKRGEFDPKRGWYRAKLINLILDDFAEAGKPIDETGLQNRINSWLDEWRVNQR